MAVLEAPYGVQIWIGCMQVMHLTNCTISWVTFIIFIIILPPKQSSIKPVHTFTDMPFGCACQLSGQSGHPEVLRLPGLPLVWPEDTWQCSGTELG